MAPLYRQTPLVESLEMSAGVGSAVFLKMEPWQPSGSFKNRGIGHLCRHYAEEQQARCFVSSSGGNAGLAVAYSGRMLKVPVKVIVPTTTPATMVERIAREGAAVTVHGQDWNAADVLARQWAQEPGAFYVPPFDHPLIWQGHSSLVHEMRQEGVKPDAVVLAVGGGGLLCGVVQGLHEVGWADVPVLTAETEGAASFAKAVAAGHLITLDKIDTVATTLGAKRVAEQAFTWSQKHPIRPFVVSDRQAVRACLLFADQHRVLVEPACGAALALLYEGLVDTALYRTIAVVVCGGCGVNRALLHQWAQRFAIEE